MDIFAEKNRNMPEKTPAPFTILYLAKVANTSSRALIVPIPEDETYRSHFKKLNTAPSVVPAWWASPDWEGEFEIPENSIAYHPVFGEIRYGSSWRHFSTADFLEDLKAAENNPAIIAHLIHIDSVGGEAYGCHEAFNAIKNLTKPCYAVIDSMAASAGYYLAAAADKIYAASPFSEVGCIGTMCTIINDDKWMEMHGFKLTNLYSNYSPLKNKVFDDAVDGKSDEFVSRFLDPLADQFIKDVCSVRSIPEEDDARKGETYYANEATPHGLIDGIKGLDEALEELATAAKPKKDLGLNTIPNL